MTHTVKGHKRLLKKAVSTYENWANQCLTKAKKLREAGNPDDALHFELEADYWFSMAEKLATDMQGSNFLACPNCGAIIYMEQK